MAGCLGLRSATEVYAFYHDDPFTKPLFDRWLKYRNYLREKLNLTAAPSIDGIDLFRRYQDPEIQPLLHRKYPPRLKKHSVERTNIVSLGTLWYIHQLVKGKPELFPRSIVERASDGRDSVTYLNPYDLLHGWKLLARRMYHHTSRKVPPKGYIKPTWCNCKLHKGKQARREPVVKSPERVVSGVEYVSDETEDVDDVGKDPNYETESVLYSTEDVYETDDEGIKPLTEPSAEDDIWSEKTDEEVFGQVKEEPGLWDEQYNKELFDITSEEEGSVNQ